MAVSPFGQGLNETAGPEFQPDARKQLHLAERR